MELRNCTHLHFMQAVSGGLVMKTLNVNHGRPVLRSKNLKDIYQAEDSKSHNSFLEPTNDFEDFLFDSNRVVAERRTISDPDVSEFSCSDENDGSGSDLDDLAAEKMTLKQIKEKCREKKRKRSKFVDSTTEEPCTHAKQEAVEYECDLMDPLIILKSKLSKKVKAKHRCLKDRVSTPSESALSNGKNEQENFPARVRIKVEPDCVETGDVIYFNGDSSLIYDNQVDCIGDSQKPREVTEVAMDCDQGTQALCSDSQAKICLAGKSPLVYDNQVDSFGGNQTLREVIEIAAECDQDRDQTLCSDCQNPGEVTKMAAECDRETQVSQTTISFTGTSSINDNQVDSYRIVPREVTETVTECDRGTQALSSLKKRPQNFVLVANLESTEHASFEAVETADGPLDSCRTGLREVIEMDTEALLGTIKLISSKEDPQCCVVNEICYEYTHAYSEPPQIASNSFEDIKEADITETNNDLCSGLPVSESNGGAYVDQPLCADTSRDPISPICDGSYDIHDEFPSPSSDEDVPCNIYSEKVQIPFVAVHGYTKSSHGNDMCAPDSNNKDDLFSNLETSALPSSDGKYSPDPESWFTSLADGSPTTKEKQSQRSTCTDTERNCFSEMIHQDACEELTASDDGGYHSKLNCPPQRLLSTRKAISPDSQVKLCKAMESIELQEEEHYRPQKELSSGQKTGKETKINTAERSAKIGRVGFSANQKQNIMKSKNEKRHDQPEGVPKDTNLSHAVSRFSTGCNSIEICSQSAIAFSQRQMQDIECLATKLTNELKTMKEIAEDRLYSEASSATSMKYKANEVRMAIKNATKVEQLANRWLSMMTRDCNRFCKIMKLAEKDSDAPESESVVNKERKKITFADEAGEELCHVRFIENKLASDSQPDTEEPEVLN